MKVYIARENATDFDLEDIILGVFTTERAAKDACEKDQLPCWTDNYGTDPGCEPRHSGWLEYHEIAECGWTYECKMGHATLIYCVYQCELQGD